MMTGGVGDKTYNIIRDGLVLVDFGPVTMTLEAEIKREPFTEAAVSGAKKVLESFDDLVSFIDVIRTPLGRMNRLPQNVPFVCKQMIESVSSLEEGDFTPMAAVAGTLSDLAADAMAACGADYAVANNGGDIALYLPESMKRTFRIGLISDISTGRTTHRLEISPSSPIHGIATSGLGGRSLTRGIASAVTVMAGSGSMADAAATAIANACFCQDPAVEQCPAEEIDYWTDIPGLTVTRSVGRLDDKNVKSALDAGLIRAEELINKGLILGAVLFVQGRMAKLETCDIDGLFILSELV